MALSRVEVQREIEKQISLLEGEGIIIKIDSSPILQYSITGDCSQSSDDWNGPVHFTINYLTSHQALGVLQGINLSLGL